MRKKKPIRMKPGEKLFPDSPAEKVIARFGGVIKFFEAVQKLNSKKAPKHINTIYKWFYPADRGGTGGLIPNNAIEVILMAARREGVALRASDFDPRKMF